MCALNRQLAEPLCVRSELARFWARRRAGDTILGKLAAPLLLQLSRVRSGEGKERLYTVRMHTESVAATQRVYRLNTWGYGQGGTTARRGSMECYTHPNQTGEQTLHTGG